jgi:threonyl-tRNA synthetase
VCLRQALELFADNPFKVMIISTKIPDGGTTTAYKCGPLIDLCMGPHVPGQSPRHFDSPSHTYTCSSLYL